MGSDALSVDFLDIVAGWLITIQRSGLAVDAARGETQPNGALNAGTGLDVAGPKQLMFLVHVPHSIELILSASVPCSAGGPRAGVTRGCRRGALSAGQAWLERLKRKAQLSGACRGHEYH